MEVSITYFFFQHWIGASSYREQVAQVLNKFSHHWISKSLKIRTNMVQERWEKKYKEIWRKEDQADGYRQREIRETEMKRQIH